MESIEKNLIPQPVPIIDKINAVFEELGSSTKWKKAPEHIEGTEILKNKAIIMVDDMNKVLESFAPDLLVATEGKATFIQYKGQSVEELIEQILQSKANLILLDYHLSEQLKGSHIAKELFNKGFNGSVVGFSSDSHATRDFKEAGALGAVNKEAGFPESSIKKLAELLEEQIK